MGIPSDISDKFYQAVTFALAVTGDVQINEDHFDLDSSGERVIHRDSHSRDLGSIAHDPDPTNIHTFVATGTGRGIIIAAYVTTRCPDLYHQEIVVTTERANQLITLVQQGFTPYRPTLKFADAFVIDPTVPLSHADKSTLDRVAFVSLQHQAAARRFEVTSDNAHLVGAHLESVGLTHDAATASAQVSISPLLSAVKAGTINPFQVSWKPETSSCEDSANFRFNPETLTAGIELHNELRLNVRRHKSKDLIDIFVSRATHEAFRDHMLKSDQYDVGLLNVIKLAVNPFNLIDGIRRSTATFLDTLRTPSLRNYKSDSSG